MNRALFQSDRQDWETPSDFFAELDKEFHFTLDPCATAENAKCAKFYTAEQDGLRHSWAGETVFCNPPYGRDSTAAWFEKCAKESGGATIVLLIPARTDTKAFHEYIYGKAEVRFVRGRLKFGAGKTPAPFPSMLAIWRRNPSV